MRAHLDRWWRDAEWPEDVLRRIESVRGQLERSEIGIDRASEDLRVLANAVSHASRRSEIWALAALLTASNATSLLAHARRGNR
jgi:hypothetical protein